MLKLFFSLPYMSMSFIETIQNIQQKPRRIRQKILFISVTVCMALIITSWLMVANRRIPINLFSGATIKTQTAGVPPFDILKNAFIDGIERIKTHAEK